MRITLKQVADDTGLSIATVSRALRRNKRKYSSNENRIYEAAKRLGYPFIEKQEESQKIVIAILTDVHQNEFYSALFKGFTDASKCLECEIVFINLPKDVLDISQYIAELSKIYSGICIFLPNLEKIEYKRIKYAVGTYPLVSLNVIKNSSIDTVSFDSYGGGYMIAKHFEEQGFKDFGIISGPKRAVDATFRKNGFIDQIAEKNDYSLSWEFRGDFSIKSGKEAFKDYSEKVNNRLAIFGCNDNMCFGFMKAAFEFGLKIPDDFIIAGFDNLSFCEVFTPELTSIAVDFNNVALKAIRTIENMKDDSSEIIQNLSMVPVKIVIRASTQR